MPNPDEETDQMMVLKRFKTELIEVFDQRFALKLGELETKVDTRFTVIDLRFAAIDVRFDELEARLDKKFDAIELRFAATDVRLDELEARLDKKFLDFAQLIVEMIDSKLREMRRELSEELARHVRAITESHRTEIGVIDDQYKALPGRVGTLETRVTRLEAGPTKPKRTRRSSRSSP